jgi:hypothetical protein
MTIGNTYDPTHEDSTAAAAPASLATAKAAEAAGAGLDAAIAAGKVKPAEKPAGTVVFVAPVERNTRILVNPTERKIRVINDPQSPTGQRQMESSGDVWLEFQEGICMVDTTTEDGAKQFAWASAHPEICRDIDQPMTAAWVQMKEAQTPTARREASLPTGLDVDRLLGGDSSAMRSGNVTADRARQALESSQVGS